MLALTDATGLLGSATAIAAASTAVSRRLDLTPGRRALLLGGVAAVALTPLGSLSPAGYLRGVTGDLSITTLVLLVRAMARSLFGWNPEDEREQVALQVLLAGAGLVLYPLALGVGAFDPYRLGYANPWMIVGLAVLALTFWSCGLRLATGCIALAVLAYAVGWYESSNLWDYLLDPLVAIYSVSALGLTAARRRSFRTRLDPRVLQ
jgi:hypothetical protein